MPLEMADIPARAPRASSSARVLQGQGDGDGHALAQAAVGVVHDHPEAIDQGRAQGAGFDCFGCELRGRRDEADMPGIGSIRGRVRDYRALHVGMDPAQVKLVDIGADPNRGGESQGEDGFAGLDDGAALAPGQDDAGAGGDQVAVRQAAFDLDDGRVLLGELARAAAMSS